MKDDSFYRGRHPFYVSRFHLEYVAEDLISNHLDKFITWEVLADKLDIPWPTDPVLKYLWPKYRYLLKERMNNYYISHNYPNQLETTNKEILEVDNSVKILRGVIVHDEREASNFIIRRAIKKEYDVCKLELERISDMKRVCKESFPDPASIAALEGTMNVIEGFQKMTDYLLTTTNNIFSSGKEEV